MQATKLNEERRGKFTVVSESYNKDVGAISKTGRQKPVG